MKTPQSGRVRGLAWIKLALAIFAGPPLFWFVFWAQPGSALGPDVPFSEVFCLRARVHMAERCIARCEGTTSRKECSTKCMVRLHDSLPACEDVPEPPHASVQLVYSAGDPPPWPQLRERLNASMRAMAACAEARGGFTARVQVEANRPLAYVLLGTPQRDMADCYVGMLSRLHAEQPSRADYTIALRAVPPQGIPWPRSRAAPPVSFRLELGSADEAAIRAQLTEAKRACAPAASSQCLDALRPLADRFAALRVSRRAGHQSVRRYLLNVPGVGFDCVRVDDSRRELQSTTALEITLAAERIPSWKLIAPSERAARAGPVDAAAPAQWPREFRAERIELGGSSERELFVCFELAGAATLEAYLAIATN